MIKQACNKANKNRWPSNESLTYAQCIRYDPRAPSKPQSPYFILIPSWQQLFWLNNKTVPIISTLTSLLHLIYILGMLWGNHWDLHEIAAIVMTESQWVQYFPPRGWEDLHPLPCYVMVHPPVFRVEWHSQMTIHSRGGLSFLNPPVHSQQVYMW